MADLSLHPGDTGDWYVLRTPEAANVLGQSRSAFLTESMVVLDSEDLDSEDTNPELFLFAGTDTDPGPGLSVIPVDNFSGVPDYYLIHVVRKYGSDPEKHINYTLTFDADSGQTLHLPGVATNPGDETAIAHLESTDISDQPVVIPLGDIDGDQLDDFIGAAQDVDGGSLARVYFGSANPDVGSLTRHPLTIELPAPLLASVGSPRSEIVFGDFNNDGVSDIVVAVSGTSDTGVYGIFGRQDAFGIIGSTAPSTYDFGTESFELSLDGGGNWTTVTLQGGGSDPDGLIDDFNLSLSAAGVSDQVFADKVNGRVRLRLLAGQSIQISFGDATTNPVALALGFSEGQQNAWADGINLLADADVRITDASFGTDTLAVANAGDLNGDEIDDLVIGHGGFDVNPGGNEGAAYVYYGRTEWGPTGALFSADFSDAKGNIFSEGFHDGTLTDPFVVDNFTGPSLWHLSAGRSNDVTQHSSPHSLYFGQQETSAGTGDYNTGTAVEGTITSPAIDLSSLQDGQSLELEFNYFLETEAAPNQYDKAQVRIGIDADGNGSPDAFGTIIAGNEAGREGLDVALLAESSDSWHVLKMNLDGLIVAGTPLATYRGQMWLQFTFNSVDNLANDYEGWYIDDINVIAKPFELDTELATLDLPEGANVIYSGATVDGMLGASVAGIGPGTDSFDDLAVLQPGTGDVFIINGSETLAGSIEDADFTHSFPTALTGGKLKRAGDIDGDGAADFVISGEDQLGSGEDQLGSSFIVFGGITPAWIDVPLSNLIPLGDINGSETIYSDLGSVASVSRQTLSEDGGTTSHLVGQVFLGSESARMREEYDSNAPDIVVEPGRAFYATTPPAQPYMFGTLGNINNDLVNGDMNKPIADFAIADAIGGRQLHVFRGQAILNNIVPPTVAPEASDLFQFDLATPLLPGAQDTISGVDLQDSPHTSPTIDNAYGLTGTDHDERLSEAIAIGDLNGDHFEDFIVSGTTTSYVLLGPVDLDDVSNIENRADLIVNRDEVGVPAVTMGDIDGDGLTDLVFIKQAGNVFTFNTFLGANVLPRNLNSTASPRIEGLTDTGIGVNATAHFLDWDGDGQDELLLVGGSGAKIFDAENLGDTNQSNLPSGTSVFTAPGGSTGLVAGLVGDVNGDGRQDVGIGVLGLNEAYVVFQVLLGVVQTTSYANASAITPAPIGLGDINGDGFDDFAVLEYDPAGVSIERAIVIHLGNTSPEISPSYTIARTGPTQLGGQALKVTLSAAAGDFDFDGRPDLAVLEHTAIQADGTQIDGRVLVFWSIADQLANLEPDESLKLSDADLVIESGAVGIIDTMLTQPGFDLNADGIDDLLLGASQTDVAGSSVMLEAGSVFAIYGSPKLTPLPAEYEHWTNRTITGSGDFLVNPVTGQPESYLGVIGPNQSDEWLRIDTLGDGLPGNFLRANSQPSDPINIHAQDARTLLPDGMGGYNVAGIDNSVVGGGQDSIAVFEFDLSSLLHLQEDPDGLIESGTLNLDYSSNPLEFPVDFANFADQAVVNFGGSDTLFFSADGKLWQTTGTVVSTVPVQDSSGDIANVTHLTVVDGDRLFFVRDNNALWTLDDSGPQLVKSGITFDANDENDELVEVDGTLFFTAHDGSERRLWEVTDDDGMGNPNGAGKIEGRPGELISDPSNLTAVEIDGSIKLFFVGDDGPLSNRGVWVYPDYDTTLPAELGTAGLVKAFELPISNLTSVGGELFFVAQDGTIATPSLVRMYRSDGTPDGTSEVKDQTQSAIVFNSTPSPSLTDFNDTLFFFLDDDLWKIDSNGEAVLEKQLFTGVADPDDLIAVGNRLYFTAMGQAPISNREFGRELWISDGTSAETKFVGDIFPGVTGSDPQELTIIKTVINDVIKEELYFTADDGENGRQLWKHTEASGTIRVSDIATLIDSSNAGSGYDEVGAGWVDDSSGLGFDGASRLHAAGTGTATATWEFINIADGQQEVLVTWPQDPMLASNATYKIYDGETLIGTISRDQQSAPSGPLYAGTPWESLGVFTATSGSLRVVLSDDANGFVAADAVRLVSEKPTNLIDFGGIAYFTANDGSGLTLWKSEAAAAPNDVGTIPVFADLGATLNVEVLLEEGDNRVRESDASAAAVTEAGVPHITLPVHGRSGLLPIVLTDEIRDALRAGKTRITIRLSMDHTNVSLDIKNSLAGAGVPVYGVPAPGLGQTGLTVVPTSESGVLIDVFDENGGQLALDQEAIDWRHFDAGTYFVRVHTPDGVVPSATLPYELEFGAPFAGQTRPTFFDPDRDVIYGGEGNDTIYGNEDIDRLFGGSGQDVFIGDVILDEMGAFKFAGTELRDYDPASDASPTQPTAADEIGNSVITAQIDPVIDVPDLGLRLALAEALGIAVTTSFENEPELARPILASDLGSLTKLDVSNRGIRDLAGLKWATNLRVLNLSNNFISDLSELTPKLETEGDSVGAPVGMSLLEYLAVDFNQIADLSPLELLGEMRGLSADHNILDDLSPISNLARLQLFSASHNQFGYEAGDIDPRFGNQGIVIQDFSSEADGIEAIAVQADGKIIAVGNRFIRRFNADGTLDTAFGAGGVTIDAFGDGTSQNVTGVAIQSDGRIVISGAINTGPAQRGAVAILDEDGHVLGRSEIAFGLGQESTVNQISLVSDGIVLVIGAADIDPTATVDLRWAIAQLIVEPLEDPQFSVGFSFDPEFASGGIVNPSDLPIGAATDIVLDDGNILIGGQDSPDGTASEMAIMRFDADGILDTGFGDNGKQLTSFGSGKVFLSKMTVDNDGSIVVVGYDEDDRAADVNPGIEGIIGKYMIARFTSAGTPDPSFGINGYQVINLNLPEQVPEAVEVQEDGKILIIGRPAVLRLLPNGLVDKTFGDQGVVGLSSASQSLAVRDASLLANGQLLVAGLINNGQADLALARYFPMASPEQTDLVQLGDLADLRVLDVAFNNISDIRALGALTGLEYVYLGNNSISNIESLAGMLLVDNNEPGYGESGNDWLGNLNDVDPLAPVQPLHGDYRFHLPTADPLAADPTAVAHWTFDDIASGSYEVWVTWPEHETRASDAPFTIGLTQHTFEFSAAAVDPVADTVELIGHKLSTGDALIYRQDANWLLGAGGLTSGAIYYAIVINSNTIMLAATPADAASLSEIDLGDLDIGSSHQFTLVSELSTVRVNQRFAPGGAPLANATIGFNPSESLTGDTLALVGHELTTGDAIFYRVGANGSAIGGLADGDTYYAIVAPSDTDAIKLATTPTNAANGVAIELTSVGSGSTHEFINVSRVSYAASWEQLGVFNVSSTDTHAGALVLMLGNNADGVIAADAVRLVRSEPLIDSSNSGSGFSEAGNGWGDNPSGLGFNGESRIHAAGTGTATAAWEFTHLEAGLQEVLVTWPQDPTLASDATYKIYDGETLVGTISRDQRVAPSGPVYAGTPWESLGVFTATAGSLRVVLSDDADGYIAADAVRLVNQDAKLGLRMLTLNNNPLDNNAQEIFVSLIDETVAEFSFDSNPIPPVSVVDATPRKVPSNGSLEIDLLPSSERLIDSSNSGSGYSEAGAGWVDNPSGLGFNGESRIHAAGAGTATAVWEFMDFEAGPQEVLVTWPQDPTLAPKATYKIYDGETLIRTISRDQRVAPSGPLYAGTPWESLGVFTATSGSLRVVLSDDAEGYIAADAVRLVRSLVVSSSIPAVDINRGALSFDNDVVVLPGAVLDAQSNFSIEFWINTPDFDDDGGSDYIVHATNSTLDYDVFSIRISAGGGAGSRELQIVENNNVARKYILPSDFFKSWHHLAVVRSTSPGMNELYIDGTAIQITGADSGLLTSLNVDSVVLGQDNRSPGGNYAPGQAFSGQLDEVRFWSKTLSQQDIQEQMKRRLSGDEAELLAYYTFDDGGDETATDLSMNGTNGTLGDFVGVGNDSRLAPGISLNMPFIADVPGVQVEVIGGQLIVTPINGYVGMAAITVSAQDGPSFPGDFRGRTTEQTFNIFVDGGVGGVFGRKFHDLDGNGLQDLDEPGIEGWQVYLDLNENQSYDAGLDALTITDINGDYSFKNLAPALYTVAEIIPTAWQQTTPLAPMSHEVSLFSSLVATNVDFGNLRLISAGVDQTGVEGSTLSFAGVLSEPAGGSGTYTYQWQVRDALGTLVTDSGTPTPISLGGGSQAVNFSGVPFDNEGSFTVSLTLFDGLDEYVDEAFAFISNLNPVVTPPTAGAPQTEGTEGVALTFDAAEFYNSPTIVDAIGFQWQVLADNGQAVPTTTNQVLTFTPLDVGIYTVKLWVEDATGYVGFGQWDITVDDEVPVVTIGADGANPAAAEGNTLRFNASLTPTGIETFDEIVYNWSVIKNDGGGDESFAIESDATLSYVDFTPDDNATYKVMLTVTDNDGNVVDALAQTIEVGNVVPQLANVMVTADINEGDEVTLAGDIIDPGLLDSFTLDVDWDGDSFVDESFNLPAGSTTFSVNHTYTQDSSDQPMGQYTINLTLDDNFDEMPTDLEATAQVTTSVGNVAPTLVTAGEPTAISEGDELILTATAFDPGSDTLTYTWDINGDGVFGDESLGTVDEGSVTFTWSHLGLLLPPINDGPASFNVKVRVSDDDTGPIESASSILTINNAAPTSVSIDTIAPSSPVAEGTSVTLTAAIPQEFGNDDLTYNWEVTGGPLTFTSPTDQQSVTLTFGDDGIYTVILTVSDSDGAISDPANVQIVVNPQVPNLLEGQLAVDNATPLPGQPITVTGAFTDLGEDAYFGEAVIKNGTSDIVATLPLIIAADKSFSFVYAFADIDTYTIEVSVHDEDVDGSNPAEIGTININVANATASIGGPYFGSEGSAISLSAAGSTGATLYEWDLDNDGQYDDATGVSPNFNALDNGVYTIGLRVNGPGGSTDSTTVTVSPR
ncbi:MAG: PKD domain-containing protein [Pirellulales bacterium]